MPFKSFRHRARVGPMLPTGRKCRLLQAPGLSPMVTTERLTHDAAGRPIEWGAAHLSGEQEFPHRDAGGSLTSTAIPLGSTLILFTRLPVRERDFGHPFL